MTWMQQFLQQVTPFLLANGVLVGWSTPTLLVRATPTVSNSRNWAIVQVEYNPPPNGAPGSNNSSSQPNGTRPGCPETARLLSLSPASNWGETIDSNPTFLLFASVAPAAINFSLQDEQTSEKIYQASVPVASESGMFKFRLPDDVMELEVDRSYRWIFQVSCNSSASPQNEGLAVNGVIIRRSNPDLKTQIESASPREKVELYAQNGLWFDTLNELLKLRCADPENPDFAKDWASLLEHPIVLLNELVEEPINRVCMD
ncbi:MAG TPA: DUF928 domain-containing protein [Oscillatoriales cyanobacterium M59_W2019_021]|nr:DUF928 domain-containing protein [Oscillatoriales cyanobacterium M4454_W2019_049]HIK53273.1 DUF928 domain-containing protein [Oscillatoriales cyanobacterium M59_W2019_021]